MFGIGTGELLLLALIALLVLGPERMPKLMRDIGKTVGDLRKTSEELRGELLSADKVLDVAVRASESPVLRDIAPPVPDVAPAAPDTGATQAEVVTSEIAAEVEPDETAFDREARLARARLEDPEQTRARSERAAAEGWTIPTDEAGTSAREG